MVDSATTHTILHERIYFSNLVPNLTSLTIISSLSNLIEDHEMTRLLLSNGTEITIKETLFSPHFERTLLSSKNIREKNYHAETTEENRM